MPFLKMFTKTGNADESLNLLGGKKISPLPPKAETTAKNRKKDEALRIQNQNLNSLRQLFKESDSQEKNNYREQHDVSSRQTVDAEPQLNFKPVANGSVSDLTKGKTKEQNTQRSNHFNSLINARDFVLNLWKPPVFESNESMRKGYEELATHDCRFWNEM